MPSEREQTLDLLRTIFPFRKLEPIQLELVANELKLVSLLEKKEIYTSGDSADSLYIVFSGQVELLKQGEEKTERYAILKNGDLFGIEAASEEGVRKLSARALTHVNLLQLSHESYESLCEKIPLLPKAFKLLMDSLSLAIRTTFSWRGENEVFYFITRRHITFLVLNLLPVILIATVILPLLTWFVTLTPGLMTPLIIVGGATLALLVWGLWIYVDWANDFSIITNQRVLFQEKVILLYDSRMESPLNAILAVTTETDQWGRILGYGNVIVRTYAGKIVLPRVGNPAMVVQLLEGEWFRARTGRTIGEKKAMEDALKMRFGLEQKPAAGTQAQEGSKKIMSLGDYLNGMFQMRFEQGGVITYRTHWFKLLENIWLPTVCIVGLVALVVIRLFGVITILSAGAFTALILVIFLIVGAWWAYQYADWRNDYYMVTFDQIVDVYKKPLGREEKKVAPIKNILSVEFSRIGLIGLFLNFGTVTVQVGDSDFTFDYVYNPSEVQQELFKRIAERDYKEKQGALEAEWMDAYRNVLDIGQKPPIPPPSGTFSG
jgi:hypothetical protein